MKKVSLRKLLTKSFFQAALIPLIVIELTLLVMYFGISTYMVEKGKKSLHHEIELNVNSILSNEANGIDFRLREISNYAALLQDEQQRIFANKDQYLKTIKAPKFDFAPNKVYYKVDNDGGASLFYGTNHKIEKEQLEKAVFTEAFDPMLKYVVDKNELIVASYFNSYDDMNRLYPFIPDVYSQYDPSLNMEDYNFYYDADAKHNKQRIPVWTNAYLDPAGQGWMVSCVVPIYNKDFLEGVTGLDVTIDKFIKKILQLELPWEASSSFMVGQDGTILAMPQKVEKIFGLNELNKHEYTDVIKEETEKPDELNIIKNNAISAYFKASLNDINSLNEIEVNGKKYMLSAANIQQTNWKLFVIIDKDIVYAPVTQMEELSSSIGWIAVAGMVLFYVLFFIYIYYKVQRISSEISTPISNLAKITKDFSQHMKIINSDQTAIVEIDELNKNFYDMSVELDKKAFELREINNDLEERVVYELKKNRAKDQAMLYQSRLAQMGEMISMIAHQWRQPLAIISSIVSGVGLKIMLNKYDLDTKEGQYQLLQYVTTEMHELENVTQNMTQTIDKFRDFYKPDQEKVMVKLPQLVETALELLDEEIRTQKVVISKEFEESELQMKVFKNDMIQVFINIIKNAIEQFVEKNIDEKHISISIAYYNHSAEIRFKDNAGGIAPELMNKIFEPYFSTKHEKNGSGLGLYMSKLMIEKHHDGVLKVLSQDDTTEFVIEI